jgi:hypothetical protein
VGMKGPREERRGGEGEGRGGEREGVAGSRADGAVAPESVRDVTELPPGDASGEGGRRGRGRKWRREGRGDVTVAICYATGEAVQCMREVECVERVRAVDNSVDRSGH